MVWYSYTKLTPKIDFGLKFNCARDESHLIYKTREKAKKRPPWLLKYTTIIRDCRVLVISEPQSDFQTVESRSTKSTVFQRIGPPIRISNEDDYDGNSSLDYFRCSNHDEA